MTNEKYVLQETNKERSKMAQGSRHKVNGCKSKKCTLPHEYLTRKELKKMNSEVITIDMKHFYTWDEFLTFSDATKVDYIENLMNKYNVSLTAISQVVFGNNLILGRYVTEHMLPIKVKTVRGCTAKKGKDALRHDAIEQRHEFISVVEVDPEKEPELVKYSEGPVVDMDFTLDRFDDDIWKLIKNIFKDQEVNISIQIHKKR